MTVQDSIVATLAQAGDEMKAADIVAALSTINASSIYAALKELADSGALIRTRYGYYALGAPRVSEPGASYARGEYVPGDLFRVRLSNGTVARVRMVIVQEGPPLDGAAEAGDAVS